MELRLAGIGFVGRLYVMLSGGGIAAAQDAKEFPICLIGCLAAGAMAASFIARLAGLDRVVPLVDLGCTTAKMCLVENGAPDHKFDFEARARASLREGLGLPAASVVDIEIVWLDRAHRSVVGIDEGWPA